MFLLLCFLVLAKMGVVLSNSDPYHKGPRHPDNGGVMNAEKISHQTAARAKGKARQAHQRKTTR